MNTRKWGWMVGLLALGGIAVARAEESDVRDLQQKLEALASDIAELKKGRAPEAVYRPVFGLAPAASKVYHLKEGVSLGGYGESVYQNFDGQKENGTASGKKAQWDMLRYVFYLGYRFSDKWLFNSEVEFEHAADDKRGEVSVEMAALDYLHAPALNLRTGLLLLPMGFLNELHEPPIFHGTNRPNVERNILPSTWRENGVGVLGSAGPFNYRLYVVNGLQAVKDTALTGASADKVKGFSASSALRDGRQKGSSANAEDLAWTGRLDVTPLSGWLVGGSFYRGNSGQGAAVGGREIDVATTLWDVHCEFNWRGLELRGLFAQGIVGDVPELNQIQGLVGNASVGERIWGAYGQVAYNVLTGRNTDQVLAPFARYERYNTQARVPAGFSSNPANDRTEWTYGLTYKPISNIVVKADHQIMENRADTGIDQWNMALGYLF